MSASSTPIVTENRIWERIIHPRKGNLPRQAAEYLLLLDFDDVDHIRIAELNEKANEGSLTSDERAELEEYIRAGDLISFLQSKARRSINSGG
ncbi:MAG: hypothetical protein QF473_13360 [Planctomycetota bacterium]|jgi:hypothetical protein|nr:hypothetical protein [Planctomycetota bacterium]MDP6503734.1 hypothetical protein [Planctomycetota bacterium]